MARTLIVSDRQNSFFTANNIKVGTSIPTSGTYSKGDIVVNIGENTATEAMWICTKAGTPGTWEVVGAGAGGGGSLVSINESVFVNNAVKEVSLGNLVGVISGKDKLITHFNSTHLMEGVDYRISDDGSKIIKLTEGYWNESNEPNALFVFELFKSVNSVNGDNIVIDSKLTTKTNNVILAGPTNEVEIGIPGFDKNNDMIMVFKNSTFMVEGVDYTISDDSMVVTNLNGRWNESNVSDYCITFVVFKEVVMYNSDGSGITMDMLGNDVKSTLSNLNNSISLQNERIDALEDKEVEVDLSQYQEKSDSTLNTSNKTIVGAINELFQNANNGKELIASAIGEPLNSSDTFNAMSNDINNLLSTFKTNMMKNGVTVDSGDKFKALIDKIATLSDSEGKGLKFASGTGSSVPKNSSITINTNLDFVPTVVFCHFPILRYESDSSGNDQHANVCICSDFPTLDNKWASVEWDKLTISNITKNSFKLTATPAYDGDYGYKVWTEGNTKWYAIGVGEEDTTLRDSLASILGDKGVEVNPEDDMATLIGKVDSISSGGLDIISATELPATGKQNQICVITDNLTDNISVGMNINTTNDGSINVLLKESGTNIVTTNGNMTVTLPIASMTQNGNSLNSFIYRNGVWEEFIKGVYYWYTQTNKAFSYTDLFGKFEEVWDSWGGRFQIEEDGRIYVRTDDGNVSIMSSVYIDASMYSKIEVDVTGYTGGRIQLGLYSDGEGTIWRTITGNGTNVLDWSDINKVGRLSFNYYSDTNVSFYITEIRIYK